MTITQDNIIKMVENSLEAFVLFQGETVIYENQTAKERFDISSAQSNQEFLIKIREQLSRKGQASITNSALRSTDKNTVYCNIEAGFLDQENITLWVRIKAVANELEQKRLLNQTDSELIFLEAMPRLYNDILFGIDPETKVLTHAGELFLQFGLPRVVENYPHSMIEHEAIHPDDVDRFLKFSTAQLNGETGSLQTRVRLIDNSYEWFCISTTAVKDCHGNIVEILGKISNIHAQKMLEEVANFDQLTQTLHEASFRELVESELGELEGVFLYIDVDNFNQVNVDHGHDFGNLFLKKIGAKLKNCVRDCDYVGRITGDQFVVFLKDLRDDVVLDRKIKQFLKLSENAVREDQISHSFTLSVGIARSPNHGKNFEELFDSAKKAMLCAKEDGGNQGNLCQNNAVYRVITLEDEPNNIHNALGMLDNNSSAFVVFHKVSGEVVSENKKARDMFFTENHEFNMVDVFGSEQKVLEIISTLKADLSLRQLVTLYDIEMKQNSNKKILCDLEFSFISDDRIYIYLKITEKNDKKIRLLKTLIEKMNVPTVVLHKDDTFSISYANTLFYEVFGSSEENFDENYGQNFIELLLPETRESFIQELNGQMSAEPKGTLKDPLLLATGESVHLSYDSEKLKAMDSDQKVFCQFIK